MIAAVRKRRRGRTAGFTLSELLVTMAIIGVVSGLGLRAYFTAIDYYGQARSKGESDMAAQDALQTLREDVSSVLPSSLTGEAVLGTLQNRSGGDPDSVLVLPVSLPTMADRRSTAALVQYHVQRIQQGNARLVRTAVPLHQEIPDNAGTEVASGVIAFHVSYLDGEGNWADEWSADTSPIAIRASLSLKDPDKIIAPAVTRSIVFRVSAQ